MKKIYYWSPCLNKVGTYLSTLNSAISITKYSKNNVKIINVCGEWDKEKELLKENNIDLVDLNFSYFKYLPKTGFFGSRISNIIIFTFSTLPLIRFLKRETPDYLIAHLLTSLPIFIFNFLNFKTKLVLRISGFPRLNFFRRGLWRRFSKKIYKITCPTKDLKIQLEKQKIFTSDKIFFLPDPIINIKKFINKLNINKNFNSKLPPKKYFISVGRLTKQKNFNYLLDEFKKFLKLNKEYQLLIFGLGEEEKSLKNQIKNLGIENYVFLMGYTDNIYSYMKNAEAFILTSLWEDPGFVIIEAALCNLLVISSNCKNGPVEFLNNGNGGILFESNKNNALNTSLDNFLNSKSVIKNKKIIAKKNCRKYTLFRHNIFFQKTILNI